MSSRSEEARIRYLHRDLILRGKLKLPLEAARVLIGPDCAYHLYRFTESSEDPKGHGEKDKTGSTRHKKNKR